MWNVSPENAELIAIALKACTALHNPLDAVAKQPLNVL